jgi:hypothetical protein
MHTSRSKLALLLAGILVHNLTAAPVFSQARVASPPPGVSVLGYRFEKRTAHGMMYGQPTPASTPVPLGQSTEGTTNRTVEWPSGTSYFYYIQVRNEGPKVIKSTALDYVFTDPDSKAELARRSLQSFEKIDLNKTKWLEVRAFPSGPPKVATVEGMRKDRRSPFDEHVEIECLLYTDGTGWKAPDAETKTCDELVRLTLHPDARRN